MSTLADLGRVIETDVLIIGGGVAGLWAANRAKETLANVLVVDKGPLDWGGQASLSGGDFVAVLPGEDVDEFVKDLVYYYDGLCEQDFVEEAFKQSFDRLTDYQRLGCQFLGGPDAKLKGVPQRGLDHVKLYPARLKGTGGADMTRGLLKQADRLGVKRLGRIMVTDLLEYNGRIVGAVGFDTWNGEFYTFKAGAVVLATGPSGWRLFTGEGIHMAFRAGAELQNMEFAVVWNAPKLFSWESQTTLLPLGATFVNANGEPFMEKYSPILGANTDPHYNVMGIAFEMREGRGPIYFDVSRIKLEDLVLVKPQTGSQLLNYKKLLDLKIDLFKGNTEWTWQFRNVYGGLSADIQGRTNVPGLFAAGVSRGMDPGLYIGGFNLCRTAVTGHVVGRVAADYARSSEPVRIAVDEVKALKSRIYAPLGKDGIPPQKVLKEILGAISPYDVSILKTETSLKRALNQIESIRDGFLAQMGAADTHYLRKLIETRAIAFTAELFLRASLLRTESRAGHYREDYPDRDDKNWLKWIIIGQKNGKLSLKTKPVPFDRYRFKPTRYYMDNFQFPKQSSAS
jgi:succinate dehydrogenase/fumarate reductase flavoprotein subunit